MKKQRERTLGDRGRQVAVIILLLVASGLMVLKAPSAWAAPSGYEFTLLTSLGTSAPGGGTFVNDFEPAGLNNRGDVLFGADLSTGGEGVFLLRNGQITDLARSGGPDRAGGVFESAFLGPVSLSDRGDAAFTFQLSPPPPLFPNGLDAALYRVPANTGLLTPVVLPRVTPAPEGEKFAGVFFGPSLNNRGALIFAGIVPTDLGVHVPGEPPTLLGVGIYEVNRTGRISSLVIPGDRAPGGDQAKFDWAAQPWVNDGGDVTFSGHVASTECPIPTFPPQAVFMQCLSNIYLRTAATGEIQLIARVGEPAPGGGFYRSAFSPMINNVGDIVFLADLTEAPRAFEASGVFLHTGGATVPVARPGDAMPGGGRLVITSFVAGTQHRVNNAGEVVFNAAMDTDDNGDGSADTGLFVWSNGSLRLVARTGTVIPNVGTIAKLVMGVLVIPPPPIETPNSGAVNNDRGQVLFGATLAEDNGGVLLLATPAHP